MRCPATSPRVLVSLLLAGTLAVLSAFLPASRASCCIGDPSAVDLDPDVEPLRVIRDDARDELVLTWESRSTGYRVWLGRSRLEFGRTDQ